MTQPKTHTKSNKTVNSIADSVQERWSVIKGFDAYQISDFGRIRSLDRVIKNKNGHKVFRKSQIKKLRNHPKSGYVMTDLIDNQGRRKTVYPHKEVAKAFLPKTKSGLSIAHHKDLDLNNNHYTNLEWISASQAAKNSFALGNRDNSELWQKRVLKYGKNGGNKGVGRKSPLNEEQKKLVIEIRSEKGWTYQRLAKKFNCSVSFIASIINKSK